MPDSTDSHERNITLCIPRVVETFTTSFVRSTFERAIPGAQVHNVTVLGRQPRDGVKNNDGRIFIEFSNWPTSEKGEFLWKRIHSNDSIKIVHTYPKFWKCFLARPKSKVKRGWKGGSDVFNEFAG